MRGPMKRTAPRVAGFAWLASSVCAVAPAAAAGTAAVAPPPKTVTPKAVTPKAAPTTAPATADRSDAQRQLSTARMWGAKHRDDLARDALRKGLLIAPDDPELLAEQMRVLLRLGDAQGAQAALARLQARAPAAPGTRRAA
ncbi:cellulose biosynthesis protein, partial [Burkholderia ambifaria]|nr:cellulose biosynthesis protein [Burkholderia ambifaria]